MFLFKKHKIIILPSILLLIFALFIIQDVSRKRTSLSNYEPKKILKENMTETFKTNTPNQTTTPTPTPQPTIKPITLAEANKLYGPCVKLPTLMYHHIQPENQAKEKGQLSLTVDNLYFEKQMQYLKDKGYKVIKVEQLINFFDDGSPLPNKSVLLTFDDAYEDFYTYAFPILQKFNFPATVFVPTGLVNNPGYLTWKEVSEMQNLVLFSNHTWSHKAVKIDSSAMKQEISIADQQLKDHNLNEPKIFAYPYGSENMPAENYLNELHYKAAFGTKPGTILCKKQRYDLPRIRIGNASLSSYGF